MKQHSIFSDSLCPSIDLLYDYAPFLQQTMADGHIGFFPTGITPPRKAGIFYAYK